MAGYRRFIAYVYEYTDGKKEDGKGFIRVEAKDGICRMDYKLTGICSREYVPARIYGYVREKEDCIAILLGECDLAGSNVQFTLEIPQIKIGNSSYGLGDIKGLVILCQSGEIYGSGWDDLPIQLERIRFPENEDLEQEEMYQENIEDTKDIKEGEIEKENIEEDIEDRDIPLEVAPQEKELTVAEEVTETEEFMPFSDGSVLECKKITPKDAHLLESHDRGLLNNQFLRHGFSQYGHLLLGIRQEDQKHILGVPGIYERQEALMAGMMGFPYFKETGTRQSDGKLTGYWYRVVDTK